MEVSVSEKREWYRNSYIVFIVRFDLVWMWRFKIWNSKLDRKTGIPSIYGEAIGYGLGIISEKRQLGNVLFDSRTDTLRIAAGVDSIHAINVSLEQLMCIWFTACRIRMLYPYIRNPSLNRPNLFVFKIHEISWIYWSGVVTSYNYYL